jgi:hypothetical protein
MMREEVESRRWFKREAVEGNGEENFESGGTMKEL